MLPTFHNRSRLGLTAVELSSLLGLLFIVIVLSVLAFPGSRGGGGKGELYKCLSDARQIQIATTSAALDAGTIEDRTQFPASWPADCMPAANNAGAFVQRLNSGGYLKTADLKVFGKGGRAYPGTGPFDAKLHSQFNVFNITDEDESSTIFLTTRNVHIDPKTETVSYDASSKDPLGKKGYIVFRKGGDGTMYRKFDVPASRLGSQPKASMNILPTNGKFTPATPSRPGAN